MRTIDFISIIKMAWENYGSGKVIYSVSDISVMVSTNHVFKIKFEDGDQLFAKLSYFGKFEHFKEDHTIINYLANSLAPPFDDFLSKSLTVGEEVYIYRHKDSLLDAWVVFYNPITVKDKLPPKQDEPTIKKLGEQLGLFHKACNDVSPQLPKSSKTLKTDIDHLLEILDSEFGQYIYRSYDSFIRKQCDTFLNNIEKLNYEGFDHIPVFVDWNIGNFSVDEEGNFFSRWDYDWFRVGSRVLDFYFFSRVTSSVGDKTVFSYYIDTCMEDRFILFLKEYHKVNPLTEPEVRFLKEAYRFFILNYVIKDGRYFFHELYASRLQKEAYEIYLPMVEVKFNADKILKALNI